MALEASRSHALTVRLQHDLASGGKRRGWAWALRLIGLVIRLLPLLDLKLLIPDSSKSLHITVTQRTNGFSNI